jgi:hypothetical protein
MDVHQIVSFTSGGDARFSLTRRSDDTFHIYRVVKHDLCWFVEYKIKIGRVYLYDQLGTIQAGIFYPSHLPGRDQKALQMFETFFLCLTELGEGCSDLEFSHLGRCPQCRHYFTTKEDMDNGEHTGCGALEYAAAVA